LIIYPILENGVSTFFIPHHAPEEKIADKIAENNEKVKALGLECLMVDDMQKAYDSLMGKGKNAPEGIEPVLPPGEVDIAEILGENVEEESKVQKEADPDDLYAFLDAHNDAKGLVDDAPVKPGAKAPDILEELGSDYGDR